MRHHRRHRYFWTEKRAIVAILLCAALAVVGLCWLVIWAGGEDGDGANAHQRTDVRTF